MLAKKLGFSSIIFFAAGMGMLNSYAFSITNIDQKNSYKIEQFGETCVPDKCFKTDKLVPNNMAACNWQDSSCNCTGQADACVKFKITNIGTKDSCTLTATANAGIYLSGIEGGKCKTNLIGDCNESLNCNVIVPPGPG